MPRSCLAVLLAAAVCCLALPHAVAQSVAGDRVAVLELANPAGITAQEVAYLTNLVRASARETLPAGRFVIMTRENIYDLLGDQGLADCLGECAVETGRNLGAAYVAAGEVLRFGRSLRINLTLHETDSGNLLKSVQVGGSSVEILEAQIRSQGPALFRPLWRGNPTPDGEATGPGPNSVGMEMVRIEPGGFLMGSPRGEVERDLNERQHSVRLTRSFLIGATEVTQAQYEAVMEENPSRFEGDQRPVEKVNWYDCVEFCNRLSEREGLTPVYQRSGDQVTWDPEANGYRLPTEAEWEYACRAGMRTRFNTGPREEDLDRAGWYRANAGRQTHDVGQKMPNRFGLFDMHGNVWEWCWDRYGDYPEGPVQDPTGPVRGAHRMLRGGSWDRNRDAGYCRSAFRLYGDPDVRRDIIGFRVVCGAWTAPRGG